MVAALLFAAYRFLVVPAQGRSLSPAQQSQAQPQGGLRGLCIRLFLSTKSTDLMPVSDDPDSQPVAFAVTPGETAADVALRLQNVGLVRDATAFRLLLQYYGLDRHIEAGRFQLSPAMSSEAIAQALMHAEANDVVLVALEGWRLEQIAEAVALAFGDGRDFLFLATSEAPRLLPDWIARPIDTTSLEGFLSPNTYRFSPDAKGEEIIAAMLGDFEARFSEKHRTRAAEVGLTPYQVVIIASIVEREAMVAEERPLIAAVFLNRLRLGMRLEADPTVQFALGWQQDSGRWWKVPLLAADLSNTVSPYNTYLNEGLPPGPICSPGLAAIEAVLWPADVDYLYFVAKGDGTHAFTASFDEHLSNVAKYQGG
ncbi:MAG: endolytic transglycosylase MltG [Anaerolineae bacterium]